MTSIQLGAALAKDLFEITDATTVAGLRLTVAALIACVLWRPSVRVDRRALPAIAGLGLAVAAMNVAFYAAIERIPLGVAVTIEFLGPLAVALLGSRRRRDLVWVACAAGGVVLLMKSGGSVSWSGVLFALVAGVGWGSYILFGAAVAERTSGRNGLALAMVFGAAIAGPPALADAGAALLDPWFLAAITGIAVLSSLVPHVIELEALRRITPSAFGIMMSLEPAVAAAAGLVLLGESLAVAQWAGIVLVVAATAGAARVGAAPEQRQPPDRHPGRGIHAASPG
ncbi:EamA family transporter [Nocardia cyriacigeorgica]|uniref:EamA family transporter n=1 Tax=Nocardia cyriacigeorgica TaxID=135487 RepID=UPI00245560AC|nr:EamA family transporter [Nocardia cyriacigeorgica]